MNNKAFPYKEMPLKKIDFELKEFSEDVEELTQELSEFIIETVDEDMSTEKVIFSLLKLASVIALSSGTNEDNFLDFAKDSFQEEFLIKKSNSISSKMLN